MILPARAVAADRYCRPCVRSPLLRRRCRPYFLLFFLLLFLLACLASLQAQATVFLVNANQSRAWFQVGYFPGGKVNGMLHRVSGKVEMDSKTKAGAGEVVFDMSMVETGNIVTNAFIKSGNVFDSKKFPTMLFRPTRFDFEGEQLLAVNGDLVLHGVTRAIRLDVKHFSCAETVLDTNVLPACKGEFTAVVYRSHFGMGHFKLLVDDDVLIDVSLVFDRLVP